MADAAVDQYWCHMCCRMVNPVMEPEVKCPICESGFVEEVAGGNSSSNNSNNNNNIIDITTNTNYNNNATNNDNGTSNSNNNNDSGFDVESERAFSLWAPILLGLMDGLGAYRPPLAVLPTPRTINTVDIDNQEEHEQHHQQQQQQQQQQQHQLDREFENLLRRRRTRSSVSFLRLLHDIRARAESTLAQHRLHHNEENDEYGTNVGGSRNGRLILVDPFNEGALILHGPPESAQPENSPPTTTTTTTAATRSFADYLVGPGLDLLLQHLAENDPNRYGTPPAQKEAVIAMPTVTIDENNLQCAVCLEDLELGVEAKEMPCKHKFHQGCIHPWLELHSSCPVCRFQMPTDDSKIEQINGGVIVSGDDNGAGAGFNFGRGEELAGIPHERRHRFPFPFDTSLSFLRSRSGVGNYVPEASSSSSLPSSSASNTTTTTAVVPLLGVSSTSHDESRGHEQP